MAANWEYKVLTVTRPGALKLTETPEDSELTALLNREGAQGWELVNAVGYGPMRGVTLYLKRVR
jgi:hypothetical protein